MFSKADIEKYFNAEKQESLLFVIIGIAAIILALIFFFLLKTSFYKGAAIPLLLGGFVLGLAGYTVYKRSDDERVHNVYAYDMNPSSFKEEELPRMKTVMRNFSAYRYMEIALGLVGVGLFFYFRDSSGNYFWKGVGLTLTIMAIFALIADYFSEQRGKIYTKGIESFINNHN